VDITYRPIGTIHTPFSRPGEMPIQPTSQGARPGVAEILPEYADGLRDLDGFSHVILVYHFHAAGRVDLTVTPFLDVAPRGVFATRAPTRPNPIGLSVVRLEGVDGTRLRLANVDIIDGTPLLDIKPYVPAFDAPRDVRVGWLAAAAANTDHTQSDDRFAGD
jgi:tRNA-Thr(GGU) m(6)t(6)A37 methyltransferase TsaA